MTQSITNSNWWVIDEQLEYYSEIMAIRQAKKEVVGLLRLSPKQEAVRIAYLLSTIDKSESLPIQIIAAFLDREVSETERIIKSLISISEDLYRLLFYSEYSDMVIVKNLKWARINGLLITSPNTNFRLGKILFDKYGTEVVNESFEFRTPLTTFRKKKFSQLTF